MMQVVFCSVSQGCFPPPPAPTTTTTTTTAPLLTNCKCGQAKTVANRNEGVTTEANEYPWQVICFNFLNSLTCCA